jgi:triacylglycerol esterase/lipase EstA (alpha/beta hydrolase family)
LTGGSRRRSSVVVLGPDVASAGAVKVVSIMQTLMGLRRERQRGDIGSRRRAGHYEDDGEDVNMRERKRVNVQKVPDEESSLV